MTSFKHWTPPPIGGKASPATPASAAPDPVQAAYARGLAEGQSRGAAAVTQQLQATRQAVEGAGRAIAEARAAVPGEIEETVTVLAMAIAQRMIVRELRADPGAIGELVRRTIASLPPTAPPSVRINPEDLAAMDSTPPAAVDSSRAIDVEWIPDPAVERGGYVVETPQRILDARLTSVFRDFYERLRDA
jgi:flagellar biosynthesis/type III secretory pathway protein FliH